ncbi:hypothetical protein EDD86DRAFT_208340 [Gorgonomyces haynaldii]|nr:hypothetical protein EDD86DRAFT_208340 [Gorgonomyces haynaldii]
MVVELPQPIESNQRITLSLHKRGNTTDETAERKRAKNLETEKPPLEKQWSGSDLPLDEVKQELYKLFNTCSFEEWKNYCEIPIVTFKNVIYPWYQNSSALLFWKLGEYDVSDLLTRCTTDRIVAMIGTSGSGKTRSIYEVLTRVYGIYFVATTHSGPGAADFEYYRQRYGGKASSLNPDERMNYVVRFMKHLIAARCYLLQQVQDLFKINNLPFTPKHWLCFQLKFNKFHEYAEIFKHMKEDDLKSYLPQKCLIEKGNHFPVFLDESQVLINLHSNEFKRTGMTHPEESFYYAVSHAVTEIRNCSFIACGTGLRLSDLSGMKSSGIAKKPNYIKFTVSETFETEEKVRSYCKEVAPNFQVSKEHLKMLIGRVRFTARYLELHIDKSIKQNKWTPINDIFHPAKSDTFRIKEHMEYLRLQGEESQLKKIVKCAILHYRFFGEPYETDKDNIELFEKGIGRLTSSPIQDISIYFDEQLVFLYGSYVLFGECINRSLYTSYYLGRMASNANASSLGFLFEQFIAARLYELMESGLDDIFGSFDGLNGTLIGKHDSVICVKESANMSLLKFLDSEIPMLLRPETAGPDIVFRFKSNFGQFVVFVQCKLAMDVNVKSAMATTDPSILSKAKETAQEWAEIQERLKGMKTFGIVIAYPFQDHYRCSQTKDRYELVISGQDLGLILTPEQFKTMKALKGVPYDDPKPFHMDTR